MPVSKGRHGEDKVQGIDNVEADRIDGVEFKEYNMIVGKSKAEYGFDDDVMGMKAARKKRRRSSIPGITRSRTSPVRPPAIS